MLPFIDKSSVPQTLGKIIFRRGSLRQEQMNRLRKAALGHLAVYINLVGKAYYSYRLV